MKLTSCLLAFRWCFITSLSLLLVAVACKETPPEKIIIRGSNTFGEELAPRLADEYKKEHPGLEFDMEFKGTPYGLGALMAQRCDIGAASREVTPNEVALSRDNGVEIKEYVVGSYSVAVVVNANNPVKNLGTNQVRDIFTGAITNWSQAGGPNIPVHLYIRNPISGTYLGFQEIAMEKKPYAIGLKAMTDNNQIIEAVAKDPGGIGYVGMNVASPGVKAVSIEGVVPAADTVNKGTYPYARALRLYTNKEKETPVTAGFVEFIQSERGQKILKEMGFVPRTK